MPQISLYVDENTMLELREYASRDGVSLSRFTLRAIREQLDGPRAFTQEGYWESLYGCLADDDSFARQPQPGQRKAPAADGGSPNRAQQPQPGSHAASSPANSPARARQPQPGSRETPASDLN